MVQVMAKLEVTVAGIKLRNPLILASGILGITSGLMVRVERAGAGGIVTKTITKKPREGYDNPVFLELDVGYINAMGLPNPGADYFAEELRKLENFHIPIIASIGGSTPEEFTYVANKLKIPLVKGFEINASCPHVSKHGVEILSDRKLLSEIVSSVKSVSNNSPVFVKLSAMINDVVKLGEIALESGADGLVAINTIRAMAIDIWAKKPVLSNIYGGLSGPAVKYVAQRVIYELYNVFPDKPLIGVGGIEKWQDVVEFILAGASAVQLGSVIAKKGLTVFNEIIRGVKMYMEQEGFRNIEEMRGLAHRT